MDSRLETQDDCVAFIKNFHKVVNYISLPDHFSCGGETRLGVNVNICCKVCEFYIFQFSGTCSTVVLWLQLSVFKAV